MEPALAAPLRIFVYGSLKRGFRNHDAYCAGYEAFRPATVVGKLFRQADGYPMMVVPPISVLAIGTSDIPGDLGRLAELDNLIAKEVSFLDEFLAVSTSSGEWREIKGEIYQWPAIPPQTHEILSRLDQLEDFYPDEAGIVGKSSLYHRVIVMAQHASGAEPVWTFIAPDGKLPPGVAPMGRSWP